MDYPRLLIFIILIVVALIFVNSYKDKNRISNPISECNSLPPEFRFPCYKNELQKYAKDNPADFVDTAEKLVKYTHLDNTSDYAIFGTNCHTFYHAVGDMLAENYYEDNLKSLKSLCPLTCTSGCMMGLYKRTALIANYSNDVLKSFEEYCLNEESNQCAHEIGHILDDKYTYSILNPIDKIYFEKYDIKSSRAYNYATFHSPNLSLAFEDCKKIIVAEKEELQCFTGIGHNLFIFSEFSKDNYKSVFEDCDRLEGGNKENCFKFLIFRVGINEAAPRFILGKYEEGDKVCDDIVGLSNNKSFYLDCYTGIGGGIGLYMEAEFSQLYMNNTALDENFLQGVQQLITIAHLCDQSKTEFINYCYAGLLGTKFRKLYEKSNVFDRKIQSIIPRIDKGFEVVG